MSIWSGIRSAIAEGLADRSSPAGSPGLGKRGERAAERFLKRAGYRIVDRSYKNHVGEIDLVAVDRRSKPRTVVFVEVKTRQSDFRGRPVEAVDEKKQRQISATAMVFLARHGLLECRFRFDIVGIVWPADTASPRIQHFIDAFPPVGQGQMFN